MALQQRQVQRIVGRWFSAFSVELCLPIDIFFSGGVRGCYFGRLIPEPLPQGGDPFSRPSGQRVGVRQRGSKLPLHARGDLQIGKRHVGCFAVVGDDFLQCFDAGIVRTAIGCQRRNEITLIPPV